MTQISNPQTFDSSSAFPIAHASADGKSAIQQVGNLRYDAANGLFRPLQNPGEPVFAS
ncbi:MAG: hypothetical protein ABIR24_05280 [Verrucomicrobiota bacterium]